MASKPSTLLRKGLRYPRMGDAVTTLPLKGLCVTPEGFPENDVVLAATAAFLCVVLELISSLPLVYSRPWDQIIPLVQIPLCAAETLLSILSKPCPRIST